MNQRQRDTAKKYARRKYGRERLPAPFDDWVVDAYVAGFDAGRRDMSRTIYEKLQRTQKTGASNGR